MPAGNELGLSDRGGLIGQGVTLAGGATTLSVTVTLKLEVPAVVGVPLIMPVDAFMVAQMDRLPVVMLKVSGGVPSAVARDWLYARLAVQFGNVGASTSVAGVAETSLEGALSAGSGTTLPFTAVTA